jgi:hypothetical protein
MPRKKARPDTDRSLSRALIVFPRMGIYAIRLSVLWINRSCKPANPAFTMSKEHGSRIRRQSSRDPKSNSVVFRRCGQCHPCEQGRKQGRSGMAGPGWPAIRSCEAAQDGGADRDRTDDLKLAKLALSQLSYGPGFQNELAQVLLRQGFGGHPSLSAKAGVPPPAAEQRRVVGPGRVERPTSRLSGVRSNHLSYEPVGGIQV